MLSHCHQTILAILRIAQIIISSFNLILSSQCFVGLCRIAMMWKDSISFFFSIMKANVLKIFSKLENIRGVNGT